MTVIINGTTGITNVNGSAAAPAETGTDTDTGIVYGTNTVTIATGGTAGLVQDASQNVGVGTTPSDRFDVQFATGSGRVKMGVVSGNNVKIYNTSGDISLLSSDASSDVVLDSQRSVNLKSTNTTVATVKKDYSLALQGGTSSAGVGITFPATQSASTDANTLDDYEEGSWTPTTIGGITGMTVDTNNCTYVKIGKLVTCHMEIGSFSGQSGNSVIIGGLPFTTSAYGEGAFPIMVNQATFSGYMVGYLSPNNTRMYFYYNPSGGNWGSLLGTSTNSSTAIIATITYIATT